MAVEPPRGETLNASVRAEAVTLPLEETAERKPEETLDPDNQAATRGLGQLAPRVALSNVHASDTTY